MKNTATPSTSKADLYDRVTARILADLDTGTRPWAKPWTTTRAAGTVTRPLRHNGEAYRGVNVLLLWSEAAERGYKSPTWMTYRQALDLGGQVRRSETGTGIVYASIFKKSDTTESGDEEERSIPFLKTYTVFNTDQIDGLPDAFNAATCAKAEPVELDGASEAFFQNTAAVIRHGGDRAFYSPTHDAVQLPAPESFHTPAGYLGTKAHEIVHWTGHQARLNRQFGRRFGDDAYAFEELVAEIGAAFVCADLGFTADVRDDHAAYVSSWLKVLRGDKRAVFTAAAHAQRAVDYLHQFQQAAQPLAA